MPNKWEHNINVSLENAPFRANLWIRMGGAKAFNIDPTTKTIFIYSDRTAAAA